MSRAISALLHRLLNGCAAPELGLALQLQLQPASGLPGPSGPAEPLPDLARRARRTASRWQGARA
jgi:hypothetical protein